MNEDFDDKVVDVDVSTPIIGVVDSIECVSTAELSINE
jgi:hypothetical protein